MRIPFNIPFVNGNEISHIRKAVASRKFSGDGSYNVKCQEYIGEHLNCHKVFMTPSCTAALEMAAILCDIKPGDEVIMPSFTFPSSANAFVLRGARIVFTDIRPDTLNIDENLVEAAITEKTKAILAVHYGGMGCEMEMLKEIAQKHKLLLIEDVAHAYGAKFNNKYLGTIGDIGCLSFHETKNIQCGEGGAVLLNNPAYVERAEVIREKGTDRSRFQRGETDKYSWIDQGSSFLMSEVNAAFLYAQLLSSKKINSRRIALFENYSKELRRLTDENRISCSAVPENCQTNAHLFYIICKDAVERTNLIKYLNKSNIFPAKHYQPLHASRAGLAFSRFHGEDKWTTKISDQVLRLPLFYNLTIKEVKEICVVIRRFYDTKT